MTYMNGDIHQNQGKKAYILMSKTPKPTNAKSYKQRTPKRYAIKPPKHKSLYADQSQSMYIGEETDPGFFPFLSVEESLSIGDLLPHISINICFYVAPKIRSHPPTNPVAKRMNPPRGLVLIPLLSKVTSDPDADGDGEDVGEWVDSVRSVTLDIQIPEVSSLVLLLAELVESRTPVAEAEAALVVVKCP
jgi:hypothetical protein